MSVIKVIIHLQDGTEEKMFGRIVEVSKGEIRVELGMEVKGGWVVGLIG